METHIHSEQDGPGDWTRWSTGYGPGARFRGEKVDDGQYVLEHPSGVALAGTREELTTLLNDGLQHLEILSGPADHSETFPPKPAEPELEVPIGGVDHADCAHENRPLIVRGHYQYCAQCGVRLGATQ